MALRKRKTTPIISICVLIICCSQSIDGLRILGIFPLQGKSHYVMCEALMKGLAAKGHQVDVYSHFPLKKAIPNFTDYSLAGTLPSFVNNLQYSNLSSLGAVNMRKLLVDFGSNLCDLMDTPVFQELFQSLKKNQPYDVVVVEVFLSNCYIAWGQYLNIPVVGVVTSGIIDWYHDPLGNPFNTAVNPSIWTAYQHPMSFWERLTNTYIYQSTILQYKYYVGLQNQQIERIFGTGYPDAQEIIKDLDLVLVNAHPSVEGIRSYTPHVIPVGGLHVQDDGSKLPQEVQKWLDESKNGCLYFTFGSMIRIETFPKPVLDAFYETFRRIAPIRVLLKIAKPKELPPGLPSNVMVQTWFSQIQVLKHKNIKAFITHGGLMSMQESLSAGIPMVGFPLLGDQRLNLRSQAVKKTAIVLDVSNVTADQFTAAIREVLNDPIYKKNAEQIAKKFFDRPMSPMDTSAFWIEYVVRHGKGSLRPPIVDMPWWKANLVDVYGLALAVLIVAYYVTKFVIKSLIRSCKSPASDKKKKDLKKKQ